MTDPTKPEARPRFRLLHLMALIAATALTMSLAPAFMIRVMKSFGPMSSWNRPMYLAGATTLALTSWTFLLAPLELFANRSRLREAARSYGTAAVFASATALGFTFAVWAFHQFAREWIGGQPVASSGLDTYLQILGAMLGELPRISASGIAAAWMTLALTGVGRRPSSWPEFAGLIFGLCWLAWNLGASLIFFLKWSWLHGSTPSWS